MFAMVILLREGRLQAGPEDSSSRRLTGHVGEIPNGGSGLRSGDRASVLADRPALTRCARLQPDAGIMPPTRGREPHRCARPWRASARTLHPACAGRSARSGGSRRPSGCRASARSCPCGRRLRRRRPRAERPPEAWAFMESKLQCSRMEGQRLSSIGKSRKPARLCCTDRGSGGIDPHPIFFR